MGGKHLRTNYIHIVLVVSLLVFVINSAHHVNVDIIDGVGNWKYRVLGIVLGSQQSFFFSSNIQKQDASSRFYAILGSQSKGFGNFHYRNCSRTIVICAIEGISCGTHTHVVVVRRNDQYFLFFIRSFQKAHHIDCVYWSFGFHNLVGCFLRGNGFRIRFGCFLQCLNG